MRRTMSWLLAAALLTGACSTQQPAPVEVSGGVAMLGDLPVGVETVEVADLVHWTACTISGAEIEGRREVGLTGAAIGAWAPGRDLAFSEQFVPAADAPLDTLEDAGFDVNMKPPNNRAQRVQVDGDAWIRFWLPIGPSAFVQDSTGPAQGSISLADLRSFADLATVLEQFGLDEAGPLERSDRDGGSYLRFEGLPGDLDQGPTAMARIFDNGAVDTPFAIDVWQADGRVERLRFLTQHRALRYGEIRFGVDPHPPDTTIDDLGCPTNFETPGSGSWFGFETWASDVRVPLKVSLDPEGRPYDVDGFLDVPLTGIRLDDFVAPGGNVIVANAAPAQIRLGDNDDGDFDNLVEFGTAVARLEATMISEQFDEGLNNLGLRLDVPGSTVARWSALELAYVTDGGTAAVIAESAFDWAREATDEPDSLGLMDLPIGQTSAVDLDGTAGTDLIIFGNGRGDGVFPMARGFDGDGNVVSLYVFDRRQPWRLMIADGAPPPDLQDRERQLLACMEGRREVLPNGICAFDD